MSKLFPTYGFATETGEPKLFDLKEGEKLPEGYFDHPDKAKAAAKAKPSKAK